jgi:hypothetical protein
MPSFVAAHLITHSSASPVAVASSDAAPAPTAAIMCAYHCHHARWAAAGQNVYVFFDNTDAPPFSPLPSAVEDALELSRAVDVLQSGQRLA